MYLNSNLPEISYFKAMTACAMCGYITTALKVCEDKVNKDNVDNVQHAMTDKGNPIEKNYADFVTDFPFVVPIVPDLQQVSVESVKDFQIHEKVKECIDDARTQIEKITGKKVQDKIFLSGYSASGVFAQRFALAYPEIINRALIGGAAGTISVPSS